MSEVLKLAEEDLSRDVHVEVIDREGLGIEGLDQLSEFFPIAPSVFEIFFVVFLFDAGALSKRVCGLDVGAAKGVELVSVHLNLKRWRS